MAVITAVDRQAWISSPVGEEFFRNLAESRQETLECWAREGYIGDSAERSALMNAKALGGVSMLDQLISQLQAMKEMNDD